ncbi:LamB/YcsF family protein [compost metagenome]
MLHDAGDVAERMLRLANEGTVTAIDGSVVRIRADSICVHGDSPGAVEMARRVRERLVQAGVTIRPFVEATTA